MIILHGGALDGQFLLWGETPAAVPAARRGRKPKAVTAGPLPFQENMIARTCSSAGSFESGNGPR